MRDLLTGRLRVFTQSLDGFLHEAQPPASVAVAAQQLGQAGRPLVEPGAFFVDGSYGLRINSWASLAGLVVTVRMRFLGSDGRLRDNEWTHIPNSNRTKATSDFPLGVGFPLNITAFVSTGTPLIGQCFVQVQIISGLGGATTLLGTLLQDYLTSVQALAFPGSPIRSSLESGGALRFITGTAPAAGQPITETVPTGARWSVLGFAANLTTDAVAANRVPTLTINSGASIYARVVPNIVQTAGLTEEWSFTPTVPVVQYVGGSKVMAPLPTPTLMLAGQSIQTPVFLMDAGDQWAAPTYSVQEWLEAAS
jgi:hypothetical protein